jgi:hypothetical protein
MGQAERGNRGAATRLCEIIESTPEIWQSIGDLTVQIETNLIDQISRGKLPLQHSLRMKIADLRSRLRGEGDVDPAVDLLVDEVVITWLETQHTRMGANQPQQFKGDFRFWEKRRDQAHGRFTAALKELVIVRELLGVRQTSCFH